MKKPGSSDLELALATLGSDTDGKLIAPQLLDQIMAGKDVNQLVQTFWHKPEVAIKSLRAGIEALSTANLERLPKTNTRLCLLAILYYVRAILSEQRHCEHLNCQEWSKIWATVSEVLQCDDSLQIWSMVCVCWSSLLDITAAIPADLDVYAADVLDFVVDDELEQAYDPSLMACIRKLYHCLSQLGIDTFKPELMAMGVALFASRARIKNPQLCSEAALLFLDFKHDAAQTDEIDSMVRNFRPFARIPPEDVTFNKTGFSRRRGAQELGWQVSATLAVLTSAKREPGHTAKKPRLELEFDAQIACFSGYQAPFSCSFWGFVCAGLKTATMPSDELVRLSSLAVQNIYLYSSAAFTLANALQELTSRDEQAGPALALVNSWLSNLGRLDLSAGSIYLFNQLKVLRIADLQFCELLAMLDAWLERALLNDLQHGFVPLTSVESLAPHLPPIKLAEITPCKHSYLSYLALCVLQDQCPRMGILSRLLKEDMAELIELSSLLKGKEWDYSEVLQLARESELNSTALEYTLTKAEPEPSDIDCAPTLVNATEEKFKQIVSQVFAKYEYNRSEPHLFKIMEMMRTVPQGKAKQEFTAYLLRVITEQSKLSPLRPALAHILVKAQDWKLLLETSTASGALEMLDCLVPGSDFGELLACQVEWWPQLFCRLSKFGQQLSSIVYKLLVCNEQGAIEQVATSLSTNPQQLFRNIGTRVMFLWCLERSALDFPFHVFGFDASLGQTFCSPSMLPLEWIDNSELFASFAVMGMKEKLVEQRLLEVYTPVQYKMRLKKSEAQIMLKQWSTVRVNNPEQVDVWFERAQLESLPDSATACWIMQQMVLQVAQFNKENVNLALSQVWNVYQSVPRSDATTATAVRCILALSELDNIDVTPILRQVEVSDMLAAEVLAHTAELFGSYELPGNAACEAVENILAGRVNHPSVVAQALHELSSYEYPFYLVKLLLHHIDPEADYDKDDLELMAPELTRWTVALGLKSATWLGWIHRLESKYGPFTPKRHVDARSSQLDAIRRRCQESPYTLRFAVNPFLHKVLQKNPHVVHQFTDLLDTGLNLCEPISGPSDRLLDPNLTSQQLSEQLFEEFTACSLIKAFQLQPELAQAVVPFEIAIACQNSQNLTRLQNIFKAHLKGDSRLVLKIVAEVYLAGHMLVDAKDVLPLCVDQHEFALGLMFAELSWSATGIEPIMLPDIVGLSKDEDIKAIVPSKPSLTSLKLSPWEQLSFSLASDNKTATASTFRAHGIFGLANTLERHSFYDYESAWMLQQWELPDCLVPKTEEQVLFNLFKARTLDFTRAFVPGPNSHLAEIEEIKYPAVRPNTNVRLAGELLFKRRGDLDALATDLALNHAAFCLQQNKEQAVAYAAKLEQLASQGFVLLSQVVSAKTAWLLGDQVVSISMLEQVARHLPAPLVDSAQVLCTLAQWGDEAKHASESVLIRKYLQPAVEAASESRDVESMAATFHTFAAYCDSKYTDPNLSSEIHQAKKMRDEHKANIELYRKGLQLNREDKTLYSKIKLAHQQSTTEQNEYASLKERLRSYLDMSLKFYLKSLALGGGSCQLNDSCRFIALWFSQPEASLIVVRKYLPLVPSYVFVPWVNQLTSKLGSDVDEFQKTLAKLVVELGNDHPHHLLWPLLSVMFGDDKPRQNAAKQVWRTIDDGCKAGVNELALHMIAVAQHKVKPEEKKGFSFSKMRSEQKWWQSLKKQRLVCPATNIPIRADCNYGDLPKIETVSMQISIANGLSAPKIVKYTTSDGKENTMLLKGGSDDLRQDAVMEQVFGHVNSFLAQDPQARRRNLRARTYAVIPLGSTAGVIEFVPNTKSLHDILDPLHNDLVGKSAWSRPKARQAMHAAYEYGNEARVQAYQEITLHVKPVMREFFFNRYKTAEEWLEKRTTFARSAATMSIVGHILGLGDRHCNNILVDVASGQIVHIDLGIAFDQGKFLRIPETVPFRLTRDIVDGMGVAGVEGPFKICAEITLTLLRSEQKQISTVLEVLRYDPLYSWNASELRQKLAQGGNVATTTSIDAEQALLGVKRKLSAHLNVMANVRDLVHQATSQKNLALIFEGWTPFY